MELKLKHAINQNFASLPPKKIIDLLMSKVCKKLENLIDRLFIGCYLWFYLCVFAEEREIR
jgi:hypothetical protein